MKQFIYILIISYLLAGCAANKTFTRLDKKYQQSDFEQLEKKSNKYIYKNPADPVPLYFKSIAYLYYYNEKGNPQDLLDALKYSYRANRKKVPEYLKQDLAVLNQTLIEKAAEDLVKIEKNSSSLTAQEIMDISAKINDLPINKNLIVSVPEATQQKEVPKPKKLPKGIRKEVIKEAQKYLGIPYKYGGTTTRGLDCSGFTSNVFKDVGITIPRTAALQAEAGLNVKESKAQPGDLLFFTNGRNHSRITHVALIVETDSKGVYKIMHATSKGVSIDKRDEPAWKSYWLPRIKMIASFIND
jgi:cell wall-associated NlpC family hydrolase